jgi:hypothetical protein
MPKTSPSVGNPILPLRADCLAGPTRLDVAVLEAVMLWPEDVEKRQRSIETSLVEFGRLHAKAMDSEGLRALLKEAADAPPLAELQEQSKPRFVQGVLAGMILRELLGLSLLAPERALMKLVLGELADGFRIAGRLNLSDKTIKNAVWPVFRPVAHLWAASVEINLELNEGAFPCRCDRLLAFLARAEAYRNLGERTRSKQSPVMLLSAKSTWRLPREISVKPLELAFDLKRTKI